jgi:hypothetical protein
VIYKAIGKIVIKAVVLLVRNRYATHLRFALGFGLVAAESGAYLAAREVPEG